jgi:hypothetical protein
VKELHVIGIGGNMHIACVNNNEHLQFFEFLKTK